MREQFNGLRLRASERSFPGLRIIAVLCFLLTGGGLDAMAQVKLLYTDWTVEPGSVYYSSPAGEQTLYRAPAGRIYYAAVGPDGSLYYSDANQNRIIRAIGNQVTVVYTHSTYLRDIAFDPQGQIYFSEATGAFRDGRIYRLNNGVAEPFFTVSLASVDGFWAGNFAFAPDGTLYLSTGNRVGSHIYRVTAGVPSPIYNAPTESIAGLDFDSAGNIYYADWFHRIYSLTPAFVRTVVLEDAGRRFADVSVVSTSIALGPEAGRVNSVALNPANPNILYSGTSSGNVFRSHDGGQSWYWRGQGITDPRIGETVVYPPDPAKVLAATPSGVFRSTNEGRSWSQVLVVTQPVPQPAGVFRSILDLQKNPIRYNALDRALYAAPFCSGLFKSTDAGMSWTQVYGSGMTRVPDECVTSIDFSPADGGTVFITTPVGIRKKTEGGAWTPMGSEINDAEPIALKVAPSRPDRIYVAASEFVAPPPYSPNVWRRDLAGGVFARTSLAVPWRDWFIMNSLAVHPTNPDLVYAGNVGLYVSADAGATWTWAPMGCGSACRGVDYRGLTFDATGNLLYAAHDQGIFSYNATTRVFTAVEDGLVNTQFYGLDVGRAGTVYGVTQDTGAFRKRGLNDWEHIAGDGGDMLEVLVDPTNDQHLFIRTNAEFLGRSVNGGLLFIASGYFPASGFWNHQLAYDAASTTLYAGTRHLGVYKSIDDGITFSAANTGIESLTIRCLTLQPGSNLVAYAGTFSDGVYKTVNGGADWSRLMSFPQPGALVITINPAADRIYAGTVAGIYRSTDGGSSWAAASTGLPSSSVVSEIIVDPLCPCALYAGLGYYDWANFVGGGVYQSTDGGNSWSRLSSLSDAATTVTSIRIDPIDRSRLYVATFGSGVRALFRNIPGGCACP
jgi:hypothetical protein